MTKPIAENRCTLTRELFFEGMGAVLRKSYGKAAGKAVLALLCAWLVMAILTLVLRQSPAWLAVEAVILALAALWISVYIPRAKTRAAWKKLRALYGDSLARTTLFYEDHLTVETGDRQVTVAYEDLEQSLTTDRLWILIARDRTGILVELDGFLRGSPADVLPLLPCPPDSPH